MTQWLHNNEPINEIDPSFIGFTYIITQLSTSKKYIGKKHFFFRKTSLKTVTLKSGEKRKKKIRSLIPSNWPEYFGSSNNLLAEIEKCGKEDFKREIIRFCKTESELTYHESREIFVTDCLLKPDEYFNEWVSCRVRRTNLIR